jgi:hypothetical protein
VLSLPNIVIAHPERITPSQIVTSLYFPKIDINASLDSLGSNQVAIIFHHLLTLLSTIEYTL